MEDILEYDKMVYSIAVKYKNCFELDDLVQVGRMGLAKAYNNFNDQFNNKFSTYAYKCILGEILNYIRNSKIVKVSRELQSKYSLIVKAKDKLTNMLGHEVSNYEISLYLEMDEKEIDDAMIANEFVKSLDFSINGDDEEKDVSLYDVQGFEEKGYDADILTLKEEISSLPLEEQKIIYYRYYQDLSQKEVGDILNTNQVKISRSEAKILKKLENRMIA